jgi:hypothetical protein
MKSKARRLAGASSTKLDSSTFTPAEPLNADVKTGMRPISRRAFKSGGKVDGEEAKSNASRTPRGNIGLANTNQRIANEERDGKKHVGGFKKGGRTAKYIGGSAADPVSVEPPTEAPVSKYIAKRKDGGRTAKMDGGTMRPMPRPEAPAKMGYAPEKSIRPKARYMDPEEMKNQDIFDRMVTSGDGHKKGGVVKKADGGKTTSRTKYEAPGFVESGPYLRDLGKRISQQDQVDSALQERSRAMGDETRRKKGGKVEGDAGGRQPKKEGGALKALSPLAMIMGKKKGGMVEGSAKDMAEDKALAKKHGMSMKDWEKSDADKKHDKACGGGVAGRTARKSGGKVGKTNINIIISPSHSVKPGAPMGMEAGIPKPPMPMPGPAMPPAGGPPMPMHAQLPPGLGAALAGAAGGMPPGGMPGGMPPRPPMPGPMMGRKSGGKVVYPITGGAGGGRARKEKVDAYGETMNKDLRK